MDGGVTLRSVHHRQGIVVGEMNDGRRCVQGGSGGDQIRVPTRAGFHGVPEPTVSLGWEDEVLGTALVHGGHVLTPCTRRQHRALVGHRTVGVQLPNRVRAVEDLMEHHPCWPDVVREGDHLLQVRTTCDVTGDPLAAGGAVKRVLDEVQMVTSCLTGRDHVNGRLATQSG